MARDTESIERDIERARDQLAGTLDELTARTNPKRLVAQAKEAVRAKLDEPAVRYALIGVGTVAVALMLRKLFR